MGLFRPPKGPTKWPKMKILQNYPIIHDLPQKYIETSTNTTMLFLGPIDPPKGPKTGMPKMYPLMGHIQKNKLPSCSIHHFELPCKKSAQTDKQFLRYSIFKIRGIWLAKSFLAIFRAKKNLKLPYLHNGFCLKNPFLLYPH